MVQDRQVRKLHMLKTREETLEAAASKSGMDEKTARKYIRSGKLPSQSKIPHTWKIFVIYGKWTKRSFGNGQKNRQYSPQ